MPQQYEYPIHRDSRDGVTCLMHAAYLKPMYLPQTVHTFHEIHEQLLPKFQEVVCFLALIRIRALRGGGDVEDIFITCRECAAF